MDLLSPVLSTDPGSFNPHADDTSCCALRLPDRLSCSHTCEIFRFTSSTFLKFIFSVFHMVRVACTLVRECFISCIFILVKYTFMMTDATL